MSLFREVYSFRMNKPLSLTPYGQFTAFVNGKLLKAGDDAGFRLAEFTGGYGTESAAVIPWVEGDMIVGFHVGSRCHDPLTPHFMCALDGMEFEGSRAERVKTPDFPVATRWATVTPVEVEYPNKKKVGEYFYRRVESRLNTLCGQQGLPRLTELTATPDSPHISIPATKFLTWHAYRRLGPYYRTHAVLEFESPVAGPLVIGNGRNGGGGLLSPVS